MSASRWKWLGPGLLLPLAFAGAAEPPAAGLPTAARVEYVLECMRAHSGGEYELLHKCSCVIDRLGERYDYDAFVEAQTHAKGVTIAGERGSMLRDNDAGRAAALSLIDEVAAAVTSCSPRARAP